MADSVVSGPHACAFCGKTSDLKRCAKCKVVRYCSREHQASDWKKHKLECREHLKTDTTRSKTAESLEGTTGKAESDTVGVGVGSPADVGADAGERSGTAPAGIGGPRTADTDGAGEGAPADCGAGAGEMIDEPGGFPLDVRPLKLVDFSKPKSTELPDLVEFCVRHMKKDGFCVIDGVLNDQECCDLVTEVKKVESDGLMKTGQLSGGRTSGNDDSKVVNTEIRSDKITWLEKTQTDQYPFICGIIADKMDNLLVSMSAYFEGAITLGGRTKTMVACYPGGGSHYKRHVDNPLKDGRIITCMIYANKDWDAQRDGGVLRIFPESLGGDYVDVSPTMGRMLMFWCDRRNPHEVQPCYAKRYAVTMWYFDAEERAKAKEEETSQELTQIQSDIAKINVERKQVEKEILQKKIDTTTTTAINRLSPEELAVLTEMVEKSPDPRAMLSGLGIASVLQDSLLQTIASRNK